MVKKQKTYLLLIYQIFHLFQEVFKRILETNKTVMEISVFFFLFPSSEVFPDFINITNKNIKKMFY